MQIDTIVTHHRPHLDEIVAIWLLRKFGEEKFPGINSAKIVYVDAGSGPRNGMKEDEWEAKGMLPVGVWGGCFDEHPTAGTERKEKECAATLVAKVLGVEDDPALEKILKFVTNDDLNASSSPFDLSYVVKLLNQQHPDDTNFVMEWAMTGLNAKYFEQFQFWTVTRQAFDDCAQIEKIIVFGGREVNMVTICSDDPQVSKFARSKSGSDAAIVIQKCKSGNVQIFTNKRYGLKIRDVVVMLRLAEQKAKGEVVTTGWEDLAVEGRVTGAEEWWYQQKAQNVYNGALTAKNIPPTKLSLAQIQEIVQIGVGVDFEPSRAARCKIGTCTSTSRDQCPWYDYGLARCRKIRFAEKSTRVS